MSYIFVSYSKQDIDFARYLRGLLQDAGYAVWMDEARLVPSQRWWPTIERHIKDAALFMVIMSPNAEQSQWVEREILVAENHARPILPILYTGKPWTRLGNIQYEDMTAGLNAVLSPAMIHALTSAGLQPGQSFQPPQPLTTTTQMKVVPGQPKSWLQRPLFTIFLIPLLIVIVGALVQTWPDILRLLNNSPTMTPTATTIATLMTATELPTLTSVPPTATDLPTLTPVPPTATELPTLTPVPPTETPTPSPTPTIDAGATSAAQAAATLTASYLQVQSIAGTATAEAQFRNANNTATAVVRAITQAAFDAVATEQLIGATQTNAAIFATRTQVVINATSTALMWTNTPVPTATQTVRPTIQPSAIPTSGYPCAATISTAYGTTILDLRPPDNASASAINRQRILAGKQILVLEPPTVGSNPLFRISEPDGTELGWISTIYVVSTTCPRS